MLEFWWKLHRIWSSWEELTSCQHWIFQSMNGAFIYVRSKIFHLFRSPLSFLFVCLLFYQNFIISCIQILYMLSRLISNFSFSWCYCFSVAMLCRTLGALIIKHDFLYFNPSCPLLTYRKDINFCILLSIWTTRVWIVCTCLYVCFCFCFSGANIILLLSLKFEFSDMEKLQIWRNERYQVCRYKGPTINYTQNILLHSGSVILILVLFKDSTVLT